MPAPDIVTELVERFQFNRETYRSAAYKEAQLRKDFIDPMFRALGWDVDNSQGYAEAYREVVHEDTLHIGGATRAPDYAFRIGGVRKFFLEAKKPSVDVKHDLSPAFQLRRYAWSAKLPVSILTDFEEFSVYECRSRPTKNETAAKGRVMYLTCDQYVDAWDELAGVFSREAILKGAFDKFVESAAKKKGTAEVDAEFLKEIESWRDVLARNFALRNPELTQRELNFAVQRTIDRLIFLRICEDRGIESYGRLRALLNGDHVYQRLGELFREADDRYNSGLFHFTAERGRDEAPDTLTLRLDLDDKVLKDIIRRLYYPESPYEFSVLPADILGQVYEQFLGKVIRLTPGHYAKVEEKPEVRKAGGVYYTPTYIVDYIVENTVGKLLEEATPRDAAKLRVLDPACGSGSFLIGAYQHLLDWHNDWYTRHLAPLMQQGNAATAPEVRKLLPVHTRKKELSGSDFPIYQITDTDWRLTTAERKRILLNNIYGVDIDPQAVEVTKLSLLLKVLEGESGESLQRQLRLWHERALPDLGDNIKCGNSLIGPDFYEGRQLTMFDQEDQYRINAFDWQSEFPEIMSGNNPGFDAVIGNPPYIRIQTMKEWAPTEVEFYKKAYASASKGNYDIYVVFVEKGLGLLNSNGRLGYILPHKFFNAKYGEPLRRTISEGAHLSQVVHFTDQQVFETATTYTCLLFLEGARTDQFCFTKVSDLPEWQMTGQAESGLLASAKAQGSEWNFMVGTKAQLFEKLSQCSHSVADYADRIAQGIRTSCNDVYVLDMVSRTNAMTVAESTALGCRVEIESEIISNFLLGREIRKYVVRPSGKAVIIPYRACDGHAELISVDEMRSLYPRAYSYLDQNRKMLEDRERGRMRGPHWYAYVYPKNIEIMACPKILVPDIAANASFAYDEAGVYAFTSGYGITWRENVSESLYYMLGLLNSALLDWYLKAVSTTMRGGFFRYFTQFIEQLPIRRVNFADSPDVKRHDRLVELAQQMLDLHKRLDQVHTAHDKTLLNRQITATDRQIDRLVYELYDLTEDEIKIVEEATSGET